MSAVTRHLQRILARLAAERGFTLIEVMVGALIAGTGLIAVAGSFDAFRGLTTAASEREAAVHVAEQEIERMRALGWDELAIASDATLTAAGYQHVASEGDPRNGISPSDPKQYRPSAQAPYQPFVMVDPNEPPEGGGLTELKSLWTADKAKGTIYRFVSWGNDPKCPESLCPGAQDVKRVTVTVSVESPRSKVKPIVLSTVVTNPAEAPVCGTTNGTVDPANCSSPATPPPGTPASTTYFLYDTPASFALRQPITASHKVHETTKKPDLMAGPAPPDDFPDDPALPALFNYSTDIGGSYPGGRAIERDDKSCENKLAKDKKDEQLWVGPVLTSAVKVTGKASVSITTQTVGGVAAKGTICLDVYAANVDGGDLKKDLTTLIGSCSYTSPAWPRVPTAISFDCTYRTDAILVPANYRIGLALAVDRDESGANLAFLYDHPTYPSSFGFQRVAP